MTLSPHIKSLTTWSCTIGSILHCRYAYILALCIVLFCPALDARAASAPEGNVPEYNLSVSFDIAASKVIGVAVIKVSTENELLLDIEHLQVLDVSVDGKQLEYYDKNELRIHLLQEIVIRYEKTFGKDDASVIDNRGIILTSRWYPVVEGFCRYRLTALLPPGYEAVSEAERILKRQVGDNVEFSFNFRHPLREAEGISLIASDRFTIMRDHYRNIELYAYMLKEEAHLAPKYLAAAKKYLTDYEKKLPPFPYLRLSVVESFLASAFSLPTFILMSREELLMPSVELTALGHEIMHQWFGNSVFTDYEAGNWNEGFTIYFADHSAQEQKGRGWQCRRRIMSGFQSNVNEKNDFPLSKFTEREDDPSRMIGYGKSAMVVHMLRKLSGDRVFSLAVKDFIRQNSFKVATWDDIRVVFETHLKRDLSAFFTQWIERPGRPVLEILDMETARKRNAYLVSFVVSQKTAPYVLKLPIRIHYKGGVLKRTITVEDTLTQFSFIVPGEPREVVIDEEYDVLRALLPEENPPTFERILTDQKIVIVPPVTRIGRYRETIEALRLARSTFKLFALRGGYEKRRSLDGLKGSNSRRSRGGGFIFEATSPLSETDLDSSSLILLGHDNPMAEELFGEKTDTARTFSVTIRRNPRNPIKVVAIIDVPARLASKELIAAMLRSPFYTHYTATPDDKLEKRLEAPEQGIRIGLESHTDAFARQRANMLSEQTE